MDYNKDKKGDKKLNFVEVFSDFLILKNLLEGYKKFLISAIVFETVVIWNYITVFGIGLEVGSVENILKNFFIIFTVFVTYMILILPILFILLVIYYSLYRNSEKTGIFLSLFLIISYPALPILLFNKGISSFENTYLTYLFLTLILIVLFLSAVIAQGFLRDFLIFFGIIAVSFLFITKEGTKNLFLRLLPKENLIIKHSYCHILNQLFKVNYTQEKNACILSNATIVFETAEEVFIYLENKNRTFKIRKEYIIGSEVFFPKYKYFKQNIK